MSVVVSTSGWTTVEGDWLVIGLPESPELAGPLAELDQALNGSLTRMLEAKDLSTAAGDLTAILDPRGIAAKRLLIAGLGKLEELTRSKLEKALMTAARKVTSKKDVAAAFALTAAAVQKTGAATAFDVLGQAIVVSGQGQDALKAERGHYPLKSATVLVDPADEAAAQAALDRGAIIGEAINLTRDLINRPPQDLYPESFADVARETAVTLGLTCDILDEGRLRHERMGSLLAVAQGSLRPPRLVVIEYRGAGDGHPVLALVGKGVTFDSGGLSIKPTDGMLTMKCDMAGAATVLGAIQAIARLKLPVNVTAYMPLVENMISGLSYKLGDILTARNGVTIEVQNTDAEGRLILNDTLCYAVDQGAERLIDLATLTGACVVALGEDVTGAFTNNQAWCDHVLNAAASAGEDIWQLPMFDQYSELLKSDVADCRNIGGRWGGAITAAKFLEKFVSGRPWVHLDIAGPAFASSNKPHREGGATGCMVRTLVETAGNAI